LLAGAAALLLIILLALLARPLRRRRAAKRDGRAASIHESEDSGYEAPTESVSQWSPEDDRELATSSLAQDHPPPRPRTVRLPGQPSSAWMPPARSLVDELLEDDETDHPEELSGFGDFDHEDDDHLDHDEDDHYDDDHYNEDPDNVDTDPTGIPVAGGVPAGRHAATDGESDDDSQVTAAVPVPRIAPGQLAIHLPMDDPYQVPDGYAVKANASSGLYYMPDSAVYEDTPAEIWFASEEIAKANGFHRAG
jgi:hypothetical protein